MTTLLFFDDWCLETHQNVERKMGKPQWVEEANFVDPGLNLDPSKFRACYYPSVFWDAEFGRWRAVLQCMDKGTGGYRHTCYCRERRWYTLAGTGP